MARSARLVAIEDGLHFGHDLIVRDARAFGSHRFLDLGAEPGVVGGFLLAALELGDDGIVAGHASRIARRRVGREGVRN